MICMDEIKALLEMTHGKQVKTLRYGEFEVEFFSPDAKLEAMSLAPQDLAKILQPSMPPDSAMLFASSEEIEPATPEVPSA